MSTFTALETSEEMRLTSLDLLRATWTTMTSLTVFVFGMLGNVATVYIYTRSKEIRRRKVFELILAAFDISALFVVLPIFTLNLYANEGLSAYLGLAISICAHSYYVTILCSTICRFVAVYRPFSFKIFFEKWRRRFVMMIVFTTLLVFCRTFVFRVILEQSFTSLYVIDVIFSIVCFGLIAVFFILIIVKLIKPSAFIAEAAEQNPIMRNRHVVAVKTFGAVTLCFLISYTAAYAVRSELLPLYADYLYFLNHICNPVIYILLNREFREKVRDLTRLNAT